MIIWIASYPKSGNTWVRAFLTSYYFTDDGTFDPNHLEKIPDYPNKTLFAENHRIGHGEIHKFWSLSQRKIIKRQKLRFLKTHNALLKVHNKEFTTPEFTLGLIYIVRDPRNVITSLKNYYNYNSYEKALNFMMDDANYIWGENNDYAKSQIISSWKINYISWVKKNKYKKILIKYEDMITNPEKTFEKLIIFINNITNVKHAVDRNKLQKAILSTNFENMKKIEKEGNFKEKILSKGNQDTKQFFYLGPQNNWKKMLDKNIINKINQNLLTELEELNYET